ncbi:MAG: SpoIVB peptidase [Christensenellales bacterium]|nr:SpoIVB peptidase [Christensenellales bacterium]
MKQTVRHGLGIALSAMAFLCNYSPWVREAASLPDALTLTSGQKFVVQTGLPMLAASDGGAVSVLASQDERVTISAEAGGQTSVTFSLLGLIPVHETRVNVVDERTLIPGGQAVGVALKTRGVLVVSDAAKGRALRAGDVILSADGKNVESTKALSEQVGTAQTDTVRLEVLRGGQTITVDAQAEPDPSDGRRKLGVWVRDSTAGVGTLTYIDPANQAYGALGHAIVDADTGRLLAAREGAILHASIVGVTKGQSGKAGELKGNFLKAGEQIGSLMENCEYGIYGVLDDMPENLLYPQGLRAGARSAVHTGTASIIATVDADGPQEYGVEIVRCFAQSEPSQKGMILRVTDERLLEKTGGIVQGMSGSPILQDGRIIGAVTHVYLSDATQGYGMYIEWMLEKSDAMDASEQAV